MDERQILAWLYERKLFASLVALETELGLSFHGVTGRLREVRDLCVAGEFADLRRLVSKLDLAGCLASASVSAAIHKQELMERLALLVSKQDVVAYLKRLRELQGELPVSLTLELEAAILELDPKEHPVFANWSPSRGRFELFETLLGNLRSLFPDDVGIFSSNTQNSSSHPPAPPCPAPPCFSLKSTYSNPGNHPIRVASFSPDGSLVAIGTNSQSLLLCQVPTLAVVGKQERVHGGSVYTCAWSRDGAWIATGSNDQTIRINSVAQLLGKPAEQYGGRIQLQAGTVRALAYLEENFLVAGCSADSTIRCVDPNTSQLIWSFPAAPEGYVNTLSVTDGLVLCATSSGSVSLVDPKSLKPVWALPPQDDSLVASAHNSLIAIGSESGDVSCWDLRRLATNSVWARLASHSASCRSLAFSECGSFLASASFDKIVQVYSANSGNTIARLTGHSDRAVHVDWGPRRTLVSCGADARAILWTDDT